MIQLKNVTRSFNGPRGKVIALNDVSLSLSLGELLAVNGPSGCGKSTLLMTAAGMLKPDQGDVLFSLSILGKELDQRAQELIQQFGLHERADHVPSQLSTGERQRTALARALFNRPKIIMADEPTGNLDDENADIVLKHLGHYVSKGGSVLLVTHNAGAADYATRILKMKDGRLLSS